MDTKLYNVKEVAQILKVNVHYVYALIQQGLLLVYFSPFARNFAGEKPVSDLNCRIKCVTLL